MQENLLPSLLKTTASYLQLLKENHIETVEDFCYMFPRAYEDRTKLLSFKEIIQKQIITPLEKEGQGEI